jgi:hypothetical protein
VLHPADARMYGHQDACRRLSISSGLGERVGDWRAGGRHVRRRPETSRLEHDTDPSLGCGAGIVHQVADQHGRCRIDLQLREVACHGLLQVRS